jgi:antitoxin VapB
MPISVYAFVIKRTEVFMAIGKVIHQNNYQVVELPLEARFPDDVTQVTVQVNGTDRILSPIANSWDTFFKQGPVVTDDFMAE